MKNIHKLNIVAASVAMATAGGANAGALGAANEIFISGATAPANFIREDAMLRICDPAAATVQVFTEQVSVPPSTTPGGDILNAGNHTVVRCTAKAVPGAPGLAGKDIGIYKFNGGSATGIGPVSQSLTTDFLDASVAGCAPYEHTPGNNSYPIGTTGNTFDLYECTNAALIKQQTPDGGVSDVEPKIFTNQLALDFGTEPWGTKDRPTVGIGDVSTLTVKPGPGLIFGTAVSLEMYDELLEDQQAAGLLPDCPAAPTRAERDSIACMPSLPAAGIRSVFEGRILSWADFTPFGETLDPARVNQGNNVFVCKRTNGSGTHAQFSVEFLQTNCLAGTQLSMVEQNDGISFAGALVGVYGNRGSSDMDDCLDALGNGLGFNGDFTSLPQSTSLESGDSGVVPGSGLPAAGVMETALGPHPLGQTYDNAGVPFTAYGMGYNSTEKNTSLSFDYRFVKVDWIPPTIEYAINGEYTDVYYLSYQYRTAVDMPAGGIRAAAGTAAQKAVAQDYFNVWTDTAAAALSAVNDGLVVDPDGIAANGDEWQGGYVAPTAGATFAYDGSTPETPWSRQVPATGAADSCNALSIVR
jgi:hypothetical protein